MSYRLIFVITVVLLGLLNGSPALAGGGRISIYTTDTYNGQYPVGREVNIQAQVFTEGSSNTVHSVGERVEFRIRNPRPGDRCVTIKERTDDVGHTRAECRVTQPGTLTTYVYSLDDGYESSEYPLTFIVYATPTPVPTPKSTVAPTPKPVATVVPTSMPVIAPAPMVTATPAPEPTASPTPTALTEGVLPAADEATAAADQQNSPTSGWLLATIVGAVVVGGGAIIFIMRQQHLGPFTTAQRNFTATTDKSPPVLEPTTTSSPLSGQNPNVITLEKSDPPKA